MVENISLNQKRQDDEILALSNIMNPAEFSYQKENTVKCRFNIFPVLDTSLEIVYSNTCSVTNGTEQQTGKVFVECLPPIRLYVNIPSSYPSKQPPNFLITISWLPPWQISFVCQALDEIWQENQGEEILLAWTLFLKNDIFSLLEIRKTLDVSFMYMAYTNPQDIIASRLMSYTDPRARNRALFLNPISFLQRYCETQQNIDFTHKIHNCPICCEHRSGRECLKLESCDHIFCIECIQQYISTKINEGPIGNIKCPDVTCDSDLSINEIRNMYPTVASKYESLLVQAALNEMPDIIYCPRKACQYPVVKQMDEPLAICTKCCYSFCSFCTKVYHGVAPCEMEPNEQAELVIQYQKADKYQKKLLQKQYGRRQIQRVVENYLSKEYITNNAKPCPHCYTLIEKIDGCNKMKCTHCHASFCWLCGFEITLANVYNHFLESGTPCYRRLFEVPNEIELEGIQ